MVLGLDVLLPLILLGGVVAVDATSFGQFMISRPFVAAALGGWVAGDPVAGAAIGVVLETFHLAVLPVGAAKYPEGGPPAVAGGAIFATSTPSPGALLLLVLFVLLLEWVAGESVRLLRQANIVLVSDNRRARSARRLEGMHLTAIALDFLRGMFLVVIGLLTLAAVERLLVPLWGLGDSISTLLLSMIMVGLLAGCLRIVGSRLWFAAAGAGAAALFMLAL